MAATATDDRERDSRILECYRVSKSFFYFLINYVWIEDKLKGEAVPFRPWPSQIRVIKKILRNRLLSTSKLDNLVSPGFMRLMFYGSQSPASNTFP